MALTAQDYATAVNTALADNAIVGVTFAPGAPYVIVPDHHARADFMKLDISYAFDSPAIGDLYVDSDGISGHFSFQRRVSFCYVPWDAVAQVEFYNGVPGALLAAAVAQGLVEGTPAPAKPAAAPTARRKLPPGWAVHEGGKASPKDAA